MGKGNFLKNLVVLVCLFIFCSGSAFCEDIQADLQMPGNTFVTGSPCFLNLDITNSGQTYIDSQLFVALDIGVGEFWFYPSWTHYPSDIDSEKLNIPLLAQLEKSIFPQFAWPSGTG